MSAANAARALLASVAGFTAPVVGPTSDAGSSNLPVRLATVDAAYTTGSPKVLFDGETVMGARTYVSLTPVVAGQRVAMLPVGHSYVIAGALSGDGSGVGVPFALVAATGYTINDSRLIRVGRVITLTFSITKTDGTAVPRYTVFATVPSAVAPLYETRFTGGAVTPGVDDYIVSYAMTNDGGIRFVKVDTGASVMRISGSVSWSL